MNLFFSFVNFQHHQYELTCKSLGNNYANLKYLGYENEQPNLPFPVHYCDLPCLFHVVNLLGQLYKYVVCNTMYVSRGYIALLGYIKQAQEIISTACSSALKKELGRFLQAPKQHRPKYILLLLPFNTAITLEMMAQIAKCVLDQSYCCSNIIAVDSLDSENITNI